MLRLYQLGLQSFLNYQLKLNISTTRERLDKKGWKNLPLCKRTFTRLKKGVYVGKALTSEQRGSFSENESKIFHLLVSSLCLTYSLDVENTSSLQYHTILNCLTCYQLPPQDKYHHLSADS